MNEWIVPWTITGETRIHAKTQAEADLKFSQISINDLAENGELEAQEAVSEEDSLAATENYERALAKAIQWGR